MKSLAIIPARGGSKRIQGKNLAKVGGATLVDLACFSAEPCDEVVVSTDDEQIREHVSARWSECDPLAYVHRRKYEHATDTAQIEPVIADVLDDMEQFGRFDVIVLLQPTSPFRTATHVREALAILTPGVDSVVSVTQDPGYRFMGRLTTDGLSYRPYRVDLGERGRSTDSLDHRCPVRENGAIYVTRREAFERSGLRMSGVMRGYLMSVRDSFEIDEPWELEAARAIAGCV